jgi:hypothetical protein
VSPKKYPYNNRIISIEGTFLGHTVELSLKCLCNEFFTSFFIVFLKSTVAVMKNDVCSFVISHLILKLSHFLYFEL